MATGPVAGITTASSRPPEWISIGRDCAKKYNGCSSVSFMVMIHEAVRVVRKKLPAESRNRRVNMSDDSVMSRRNDAQGYSTAQSHDCSRFLGSADVI